MKRESHAVPLLWDSACSVGIIHSTFALPSPAVRGQTFLTNWIVKFVSKLPLQLGAVPGDK